MRKTHHLEDVIDLVFRSDPTITSTPMTLTSIAVSLKRIADALEALAKGHFTP